MLITKRISGDCQFSWGWTLFPFEIVLSYLFFHLIQLTILSHKNILALDNNQYVALIGYYLSFFLMFSSCIIKSAQDDFYHAKHFNNWLYISWCISLPIFVFSANIILYKEGKKLAESRGHKEPELLSKTSQGWEPTLFQKSHNKLLFGEISSVKPDIKKLPDQKNNFKSISNILKTNQLNNQTYQNILSSSIDEIDPSKRRISEIELSFIINNDINI